LPGGRRNRGHNLRACHVRQIVAPPGVLLERWFDWTLSDAGAAILLTPLLLLLRTRPTFLQVARKQPGVFLVTTATSLLAVGYLLFGTTGIRAVDAGASFLVLLPLLWLAVRMSLRVAYPMFVFVILATIVGTMAGHGPFFGVERGGTLIIFAQMAIGFGTSVLLLGGARRPTSNVLPQMTCAK
jgi:integral membrane sensor domain MASE1